MKKKSERKLKREEIRKKLEDALELRAQKLKEYRETPTKRQQKVRKRRRTNRISISVPRHVEELYR